MDEQRALVESYQRAIHVADLAAQAASSNMRVEAFRVILEHLLHRLELPAIAADDKTA